MNIWVIVAIAFSAIFMLAALGNMSFKSKPAAVFLFIAGVACDIYIVTIPDTMPDFIRYMFVMLMFFQLFSLLWVMMKGNSSGNYRRY